MSPLRRRMIEDMQIRNLAPNTQRVYIAQVVPRQMGWTAPTASMCHDAGCLNRQKEPPAMSISMIGLDTAKTVFQIHGVDKTGRMEIRRKLRRNDLITFFEKQAACTVVMEACGAAHHWARMLTGLGHSVKLIAPEAVKPFVKKGKKNECRGRRRNLRSRLSTRYEVRAGLSRVWGDQAAIASW